MTPHSREFLTIYLVDQKETCRFAALRPARACYARDIWALTLVGPGTRVVCQCHPCALRLLRLNRDRGWVKRVDRAGIADLDPEPCAPFVIGARFE